ncbi:MAG TPA: T9SS type A sorting domain-containing protein [Candidatus Eisenbacteria bacterium]|uniref:T9SS type A sorting domain-containing protein n=1 Tax=Eiseniibacteriota bacterium TaxID=2212470 RepID=A0A7V2F309_UNCEI|nr:T9SS type A sorting domain-containing protein [Candidatus Eisenbacteria bacterium]
MDVTRGLKTVPLDLQRPSPPSLADISGDGIMETLIRDRDRLFMLTGMGSLVTGWPVPLEENLVRIEPDTAYAQPAAADVDQDGAIEAVFNIAGEVRACRADGSIVEGWPLRGEGDHSVTPAFCPIPGTGSGYGFFMFVPGGSGGISGTGQTGTTFFPGVSTVSRIRSDIGLTGRGTWPMYRFDAAGTSRQYRYEAGQGAKPLVDGNSMTCYPNPARGPSFNVRLDLSDIADVTVRLFNLEGTQVYESTSRHEWTGDVPFEASVPTAGLASGVYLCHVRVQGAGEEWSGSKKVAILR